MRLAVAFLELVFIGSVAGCSNDPVEKCVNAQVKAAAEKEKDAVERAKRQGGVDWGRFVYPSLPAAEVEADARLKCLKAASGKS